MKTPLCVSITLLWLLATAATAQPEAKPVSSADSAPALQPAGTPNPVPTPDPGDSSSAGNDLRFVVAVFRHGVRSPLKPEGTPRHSGSPWPDIPAWKSKDNKWGNLTAHGFEAVIALGDWYGAHYTNLLNKGFKAYLWADVDERTQETAAALATGLAKSLVKVKVGPTPVPSPTPDPLFHPFEANCGTPSKEKLDEIAQRIRKESQKWLGDHQNQLTGLYQVLDCRNECGNTTCEPLSCVKETSSAWASPTPTPSASPPKRPSSPIKWDGQFSYGSTATENFLLEYANKMAKPGWGRVEVGQTGPRPKLSDLLKLHEFYFKQTERDPYLAAIGGTNLVREILTQLNRKADHDSSHNGKCPHGNPDDKFVGLVGHDTNLAHLNTLLNVTWNFNNTALPGDTRNLPDNDAIPAGALVFELRGDKPNYRVRIQYVAQDLDEIKNVRPPRDPYRVQTTCGKTSPCEMSLDEFNTLAGDVISNHGRFLSGCQGTKQACP